MKRVNNIYDSIVDIKKIQKMYDSRIKINTRNKKKLETFENNYVSNMIYIKNTLKNKSYVTGKYNIFLIKEPKVRLIMSQNIIDKIINHLVSEYFLVQIFDKTLINENIATRVGKGTHYGIKLVKKYLNELKGKDFYILKFDISKYFYNLDHEVLKTLIRKKIKDKDALNILDEIIDSTDKSYVNETIKSYKKREIDRLINSNVSNKKELIKEVEAIPEYKKGKGLPIGNMSSQALAILYLNELDHYIKNELNIKYYIRYMDDGILIHEDKEYLKYCLKEIEKILFKYKLTLNNKTAIVNIKEGFEFLGFRYNIKNDRVILKVKNQTKRRFKRKLKLFKKLLENKKITINETTQVINSYLGHLKHGNSKKLIYMAEKKYKLIVENNDNLGIEIKIINEGIVKIYKYKSNLILIKK